MELERKYLRDEKTGKSFADDRWMADWLADWLAD
jgi:hypothetical protein